MKKTISKITLLFLVLVMSCVALIGCSQEQGSAKAEVLLSNNNKVVIKINEAEENATLMSAMKYLKSEGKMQFEMSGDGMIQSINGVANPADWSACWMLYTSDSEMANMEWGTTEYDGILGHGFYHLCGHEIRCGEA